MNNDNNPVFYWLQKIYNSINIDNVIKCINNGLNIGIM
jgi:hypothetical protein